MSAVTKKAIFEVLSDSTTLAALLGTDENGSPSVFNATLNEKISEQGWTYDAITFREAPGQADLRLRSMTVDTEYFDIEIWCQTASATAVGAIHVIVDGLLHNQRIALDSGVCFDCVRVSQEPDLYDPQLNLHFGLYRYRLVASR